MRKGGKTFYIVFPDFFSRFCGLLSNTRSDGDRGKEHEAFVCTMADEKWRIRDGRGGEEGTAMRKGSEPDASVSCIHESQGNWGEE